MSRRAGRPDSAKRLVEEGIDNLSLNPDTVVETLAREASGTAERPPQEG